MWARIHKVDRIRPQPNGGAIILVEDERNVAQMSRVAPLSTVMAIARVLNAQRVLDSKYNGKGEIRYATNAQLPQFLFDAVMRAGAAVSDRTGENVIMPAKASSVGATVDTAFSELATWTRTNVGTTDMIGTLRRLEATRKKSPLDKEAKPELYWPAVFELASVAGELSRPRGGRWVETREMPVPFALKFTDTENLAYPTRLAQRIVEGESVDETLATETT
ncbi:MAG TPA: hypothetical protein VGO00_07960 [Kofleriaceae bacterium]|jgi:hypothetical protein|nr:hypothetical protein [Kofleriaceae bacterium]